MTDECLALTSLKSGSRIAVIDLEKIVAQTLTLTGMPNPLACAAAALLVYAQRSGIDSHGLMHLPAYVRRLLDGSINPQPAFKFDRASGATSAMDADLALGCLAANSAMHEAMRRADLHGVGIIAVRNSSHFGPAGIYVETAAKAGYIAMAFPTHLQQWRLGVDVKRSSAPTRFRLVFHDRINHRLSSTWLQPPAHAR